MNVLKYGQIASFEERENINFDTALASSDIVVTMEPQRSSG
jgi:hypothetical protein